MIDFKFADIGEGIHEGKILKLMVKEGDEVKDGDTLFLVETDKVNAEIPSPASGKIHKIFPKEGDIIHVGDVVVKIDDGKDIDISMEEPRKEAVKEGEDESTGVVGELMVSSQIIEDSNEREGVNTGTSGRRALATPVARKLAKDLNIDINTIRGTGPVGRVMKEDIYRAKEETANRKVKEETILQNRQIDRPEIKTTGEVERVPLTMLRKTIAKNMVLSKSIIPHAVAIEELDVTDLVKFKKEQKEIARENGISLTYMPFIIKALTLALKEFPMFNASYDEKNGELILKKYYNIGIATDTPDGLMVPVIKNTDKKGIFQIAKELAQTSEEARKRTISIDKLQDGTISITNFGAVGTTTGIPVIKHPEVAILGIGKITKKPVVVEEQIEIRDMVMITLAIDHRVIDGGDSGRFLNKLKEYLNNPMLLVLS